MMLSSNIYPKQNEKVGAVEVAVAP